MDTFSAWWVNTPFRKRLLDRITKTYYSEYTDVAKGKTVLEIGCGSGAGTNAIAKYFSPETIIATDLDPRLVAQAKHEVRRRNVTFEQADATKLPYKGNSFAAVFDYGAMHHIPSPEWRDSLDEIYRVLKPGGIFFVWDISIEYFETIPGRVIRFLVSHPYARMYRREEFIRYLSKAGFRIVKKVKKVRYFVIVAQKEFK